MATRTSNVLDRTIGGLRCSVIGGSDLNNDWVNTATDMRTTNEHGDAGGGLSRFPCLAFPLCLLARADSRPRPAAGPPVPAYWRAQAAWTRRSITITFHDHPSRNHEIRRSRFTIPPAKPAFTITISPAKPAFTITITKTWIRYRSFCNKRASAAPQAATACAGVSMQCKRDVVRGERARARSTRRRSTGTSRRRGLSSRVL